MLYCYSLVLFLTHPLCVCLCVCRTWRRRRSTSGTPRDWTPWSRLQSRASPSTSPRCAAAQEEAGGGREGVREGSKVQICVWSSLLRRPSVTETGDEKTSGWGEVIKRDTFCAPPTSHFISSCPTCDCVTFPHMSLFHITFLLLSISASPCLSVWLSPHILMSGNIKMLPVLGFFPLPVGLQWPTWVWNHVFKMISFFFKTNEFKTYIYMLVEYNFLH